MMTWSFSGRRGTAAALLAAAALACAAAPDPPGGTSREDGPATATDGAAAAEPSGPIVARVNGVPLHRGFYDQNLQYIRDRLQREHRSDSVEAYLNARFDALENLVNDELIYQHAREEGPVATDAEVRADFERLAAAARGEANLLGSLRAQGIDRDQALEGIRRRLSVNKFIEQKLAAGLEAGEAEVVAYYNEHLAGFTPELWVKVYHILIRCERSNPADEVAGALRRAEKILDNIRAGQPFEKMAREFSEDRSAALGGSIGSIRRGVTYPEFEAVAFTLPVNEVSEPVRTDVGFHLIMVKERRGGVPRRFEEVKEECRLGVLTRKKAQVIRELVDRLRAEARIETYLR